MSYTRKREIPKAKDNELVADYVNSYALLFYNYNTNGGIKQLQAHCNDLEKELLKRGLLTEEQVKFFNS